MKSIAGGTFMVAFVLLASGHTRAEGETNALAVLDKAIKALGGEEKLSKVKAVRWEAKGTITLGDNENKFASQTTIQDPSHFRREVDAEFDGNKFHGVTVLDGNKGWRAFGDNKLVLDDNGRANEKRNIYLQVIANSILPLKGKDFKVCAGR